MRVIVAGLGACAAAAIAAVAGAAASGVEPAPHRVVAGGPVYGEGSAAERNTTAADYIGPEACGGCHPENHAAWRKSLHAAMNTLVSPATPRSAATVKGDFANARLAYADGEVRFVRRGDGYEMQLARRGRPERRYRVTRTIGSRWLQEYVGVLVAGPEPAGDPAYSTEIRLPFGFWLARRGWYPQPYFDSWFPAEYAGNTLAYDPYFPEPTPWATRCAWCHNTYPFDVRLQRSDASGTGHGLEQYFQRTPREAAGRASVPMAGGPGLLPGAAGAVERAVVDDNRLPVERLVTVGVSCESCHLGGRAHADGAPISFVPRGPELVRREGAPAPAGRADPVVIGAICAQCHSTPAPHFPDGASARNSSEALDLAAGACRGVACTDCHDPHVAGPPTGAPDAPRHLAACTKCHAELGDAAAARAHARHAPADASCLDCHMPRIVQGIAAFARTHRIGSPSHAGMLGADGVNACNLCHLDRSIAWTARELARGWGVTGLPEGLDDRPAGASWLASRHGAVRITAAAAWARSRPAAAPARLAAILDDPIAYYRMWTLFAIEDALGRRLTRAEYDPLAAPAVRAKQVRALERRWRP